MWYFNIASLESDQNVCFGDYTTMPPYIQAEIDIDHGYRSELATKCDAAFQILQKGFFSPNVSPIINSREKHYSTLISFTKHRNPLNIDRSAIITDVNDNYRFVRRFFGGMHATQILLARIFSLHNPLKELIAYFSTRKIKRVPLYETNGWQMYQEDYNSFKSDLIQDNPKVTVIIPTLNRYKYLYDVLRDLESQSYKNFEVIIVDQSDAFSEDFYNGWRLELQVIRQQEKALWLARNSAVRRSKGKYILLYDDDSRVESDWIYQHLKCLDYFKCDISSGVSISTIGDKIPKDYEYFKWSAQIDTGNVMFHRNILRHTGLFDRRFERERMGDGEFGLRAYLHGRKNISNPFAKRVHLKVSSGGLRQMGAWDAFQNKKIFAPRPIPSILYYCRKYYGDASARSLLAFTIPFSLMPYRYKGNNRYKLLSLFIFLLTFPIIILQVIHSWKIAGRRITDGDRIEIYET